MSNPDVYPITAAFEGLWGQKIPNEYRVVYMTMRDVIGEYEHGSADVDSVDPAMTVKMYADVCDDILASLVGTIDDQDRERL